MSVSEAIESDIECSYSEHITNPPQPLVQIANLDSPSAEINSSILEFLDMEKKCLNSNGGDNSEVDIKTLLEEISKLSSESSNSGTLCQDVGDRSIEDIINEAERLVNENSVAQKPSSPKSYHLSSSNISKGSKLNNNYIVDQKYEQDCLKKNKVREDENENKTSIDKCTSYGASFDTDSDANSLNDLCDLEDDYALEGHEVTIVNLEEDAGHFEREHSEHHNSPRAIAQPVPENVGKQDDSPYLMNDHSAMHKRNSKTELPIFRDSCTSPIRDVEEDLPTNEELSFKKYDDRLKELQDQLKQAKIHHNSIAASFDSLSQEHAALQIKYIETQAEAAKMSKLFNNREDEIEKYKRMSEELQAANLELQKNLESERALRKATINTNNEQQKLIQDLQRQIRDVNRLLANKHPDSVSALVVACNNPNFEVEDSARRILEDRIQKLEAHSKSQNTQSQLLLETAKNKFSSVKLKYENHISDLESQIFSLQEINKGLREENQVKLSQKADRKDQKCQTDIVPNKSPTTGKPKKKFSTVAVQTAKITQKTQPARSMVQSKALSANKEETHLLSTIRSLKQDLAVKEKALCKVNKEFEDFKKNIKRKANPKLQAQNKTKEYDPQTFTDAEKQQQEQIQNRALQLLQREYQSLVEKRLQDLNALQNTHERELSSLEGTIHTLHKRIREKDSAIASLKGQIKTKVSALEKRQIEREQTLQSLVSKLSNGKHDKDWINM